MAVPADEELRSLLDQFVCVRIVQMHGVDLKKFEFDGALTWAIFFMNADNTIYGRYGSRSGLRELSDREISLAGFKKSLRGALDLHAAHAADEQSVGAQLAGKVATSAPPWRKPEAMGPPRLRSRSAASPKRLLPKSSITKRPIRSRCNTMCWRR